MDTNAQIDQVEQPELDAQDGERRANGIGMAAWVGSAVTHATALALMMALYWTVATDDGYDLPPIPGVVRPELPNPKPPPVTDAFSDNKTLVLKEVAEVAQVPTPIEQLLVADPGEEEAPSELPPAVKGDASALSDVEMGSTGLFPALGAGAGASGKYGGLYASRGIRGVKGPRGAPRFAVDKVRRSLNWFRRHQSPNGMWDADGYFNNCTDAGPKCEPGKDQAGNTDVATTGYAILCFLGDGYDQTTPSRYRSNVRRGLEWLIASQKPDGLLGERNYEHAVATMAMAQAYGMSPEPWLREPTQKAVDVILARQNRDPAANAPYDRLGWDYVNPSGRNDGSVTGWNVMALKSALAAGLKIAEVSQGLDGGKAWLTKSWQAANSGKPWCASTKDLDPYKSITRFPYVWKTGTNEVELTAWNAAANRPESIANQDLAPVGLMSAVFLGHRAGDPMLESLANYVSQYHMPTSWPCNTYYLYYNTLGMFQVGGDRWEKWSKTVLPMLGAAQRTDEGCLEGSWDWQGTQFHGHDTGRVLSTAYACLSMQVYWIYERTQADQKKLIK